MIECLYCDLQPLFVRFKDKFLLSKGDDRLLGELNRREHQTANRMRKLEEKVEKGNITMSNDKWKEQHTALAEQLGVRWPLVASPELESSGGI